MIAAGVVGSTNGCGSGFGTADTLGAFTAAACWVTGRSTEGGVTSRCSSLADLSGINFCVSTRGDCRTGGVLIGVLASCEIRRLDLVDSIPLVSSENSNAPNYLLWLNPTFDSLRRLATRWWWFWCGCSAGAQIIRCWWWSTYTTCWSWNGRSVFFLFQCIGNYNIKEKSRLESLFLSRNISHHPKLKTYSLESYQCQQCWLAVVYGLSLGVYKPHQTLLLMLTVRFPVLMNRQV